MYIKVNILLLGDIFDGELNGWYGPSGRNDTYDIEKMIDSKVGKAMKRLGQSPTINKIKKLR